MLPFEVLVLFASIFNIASARAHNRVLPRAESVKDVFAAITPSTSLVWHPCLSAYFCARLDVPLSYAAPNGTRAYVPLIKLAATTTPYKGMVLVNPGGPGDSGIDYILAATPLGVFDTVGKNYDIVGWEPRGVGYSVPSANCSLSFADNSTSPTNFTLPTNSTLRTNTTLQRRAIQISGPKVPDTAFELVHESGQLLGAACQAAIGGPNDAGPHMSTLVTVKDMVRILDAYAKSPSSRNVTDASTLNYWGFSYGTYIGQTFASLYPERVGKVVLDGVVDAEDFASGALLTNVQSTDDAFSTFFVYCNLAGAEKCPFYTGTTPQDIADRFETLLRNLDPNVALENNWENATTILTTFISLKAFSRVVSYNPINTFPEFSRRLVDLEQATATQKLDSFVFSNSTDPVSVEWLYGVACTDTGNVLYNQSLASLEENKKEQIEASYIGGETWELIRVTCTGWSIKAEEIFQGPFGGNRLRTKSPILFVGNTRDPVTPLINARKSTTIFRGAQVLAIDGTGHASTAVRNNCANAKIYAYFQNGTLPGTNNFCALETGPWNITVENGIEKRNEWSGIKRTVSSFASVGKRGLLY